MQIYLIDFFVCIFQACSNLHKASSSSLNTSRSSSMDSSNEATLVTVNTASPKTQQQQHMSQMINSYNLAGIMNDFDLVNLPLRELNKRLRFLPKQMAYNMKKRRRTLKNRKYAQNCRSKRLEQKSEMEIQNSQLKIEINRLGKMVDKLQSENVSLKNFIHANPTTTATNTTNSTKSSADNEAKNGVAANSFINNSASVSPQMTVNAGSQLTHLLSLPLIKSDPSSNIGPTVATNRHMSINAHYM